VLFGGLFIDELERDAAVVGVVPHVLGIVCHAVADGRNKLGVVFHDEHARADAGDGVPDEIVVAIDVAGEQVNLLVGDVCRDQLGDIVFGEPVLRDDRRTPRSILREFTYCPSAA